MGILTDITDFIFPRRRHICGVTLAASPGTPAPEYVCPRCLSELPRTLYHRRPNNPMEDRFAGIFPFERASGHFFYSPSRPSPNSSRTSNTGISRGSRGSWAPP